MRAKDIMDEEYLIWLWLTWIWRSIYWNQIKWMKKLSRYSMRLPLDYALNYASDYLRMQRVSGLTLFWWKCGRNVPMTGKLECMSAFHDRQFYLWGPVMVQAQGWIPTVRGPSCLSDGLMLSYWTSALILELNDMDQISYLDIHARYLNIDMIWLQVQWKPCIFQKVKRLF